MRKRYVTQWHGIRLKDFIPLSAARIVDEQFYKAYYKVFFKRYRSWAELPAGWVILKQQAANFLKEHISDRNARVLSIGCGIGLIEKYLIEDGYKNLGVTEVAEESLFWIRTYLNPDKIHLGKFPACVLKNDRYDYIYIAGVECLLLKDEFISLLNNIHAYLTKQGKCMIMSWTCEPSGIIQEIRSITKDMCGDVSEFLRLRSRGQFFGYSRKTEEFYDSLRIAGFSQLSGGLLKKVCERQTFWIEGKTSGGIDFSPML